jgi:hypothetical protein
MRVDTAKHNEEVHVSKTVKLLTLLAVVAVVVLPTLARAEWKEGEWWPAADKAIKTDPITKSIMVGEKTYKLMIKKELWVNPAPPQDIQKDPVAKQMYPKENAEYPTWHEITKYTVDPLTIPDMMVGWRTSRAEGKIYVATPPVTPKTPPTPTPTGWKRGVFLRQAK